MSSVQLKQEESLPSERMSMYENMVEDLVNSENSDRFMIDGKIDCSHLLDIQLKMFPLNFLSRAEPVILMYFRRPHRKFAFNDD
jgi:hypothetical protein